MSLINKVQRELRQGGSPAKPDSRVPAGLRQINRTVLIGVCLALTLVLLVFPKGPGRSSAPEKPSSPPESTVKAEEGRQAVAALQTGAPAGAAPPAVLPPPVPVSVPPATAAVGGSPEPPGAPTPRQNAAVRSVRVDTAQIPAIAAPTGRRHEAAVAPVAEIGNALTEEEARYVPVYSFADAEQAYLAGKRALVTASGPETAINYLRQALARDRGHLLARELLAEIYHKVAHRHKEAMALLQEGIAIAPDHQVFSKKYALILGERGDHAAAATVLLRSGLPSLKNDREALELLASLYLELDEPYLAAQTYRALLGSWPADGEYWFLLGVALEAQRQTGEAADCYQKALETHSLGRERADQASRKIAELRQSPSRS